MPLRYLANRALHYGSDRLIDRITRTPRSAAREERVLEVEKPEKSVPLAEGVRNSLVGAVATRLATRSVPGAIVVGGAMLAKTLYDRRHRNDPRPARDADTPADRTRHAR